MLRASNATSDVHVGVLGVAFHMMIVSVFVLVNMLLVGFHLDDEVAGVCVDIARIESTAVGFESATSLLPTGLVEVVKVISPGEVE